MHGSGALRWAIVLILLTFVLAAPRGAQADAPDYAIAKGWFFRQTAGDSPGGYSVVDDAAAPFWSTFQAYGGVDTLGYPISRRFLWEGSPAQAFQKAVFHWRPDLGKVVFVNVFDELSKAGKDPWLKEVRLVPKPEGIPDEDKLDFATIVVRRQALLDENPAMRQRYNSVNDPLLMFGLPVSPVTDLGTVKVVRMQRAVLQQWKTDRPWAKAGDVVIANGGDVAKEAGLFPESAIVLEPPGGAADPLAVTVTPSPTPAIAPTSVTPFAGPTNTPTLAAGAPIPTSTPIRTATPGPPAGQTAVPNVSATPTHTPEKAVGAQATPPAPATTPPAPTATPVAPAVAPGTPPSGAIIVALDPGHGGLDAGAVARFSDGSVLREKDVNLTVSLKLTQMLRAAGFWVVLTRDSDVGVNPAGKDVNGDGKVDIRDDLQARIDIANNAKASLFISVHHNGHDNPALSGLEIYSCKSRPFGDQNLRFAKLAEDYLLKNIRAAGYGLTSRGQKDCYDQTEDAYYYVIGPVAGVRPRSTNMPGIIGEPMFMTNLTEAAAMRSDAVLNAEAKGYFEAIKAFFGR